MKPDTKKTNSNHLILIVEDSPTQAEKLKYLLESKSYQVNSASNGYKALQILQDIIPSIIISDVIMPLMDGYELCKKIKSDERLKHIPVILLTALSEAKDIIRGLECGADSFIRKPYDDNYLVNRVNYIIANQAIRKSERVHLGIEINLAGERHFITSEKQQILDLLISTYDQAVHMNGELKHSHQTLDGLYSIAKKLNKCTNQQEVLNAALEEGLKFPGIEAGWILLVENDTRLKVAAVKGLPSTIDPNEFFDGECYCWKKFFSGELDRVTNILDCERLNKTKIYKSAKHIHATIPLKSGEKIFGLMNLVGLDKDLFSEEELETFFAIGNQIGTALERTRLFENLEYLVEERTSKLLETEIWFRTVFNCQHDAVFVITPDRRVVNLNIAAEKLFGYTIDEVKGKSTEIFHVDCDHYETFGKLTFESFERGEPARFEFQLKKKNGETFPSEHTVSFIQDESGNITGIVSVARDITERKHMEEVLKQSENKYRSIFESAIIGIFQTTVDGRYLLANPTLARLCGYETPAELMESITNLNTRFYVEHNRREEFIRLIEEHGLVENFESPVYRKDGSIIWISELARGIRDDEGKLIGFEGTTIDITQRKKTEEEKERVEKILHLLSNAMQSVNECVCITDLDDTIIFVNDAFTRTYGFSKDELLGQNISKVRSRSNPLEKVESILPETLKGGWQGELLNKRKDGSEFPIWLSTALVRSREGESIALVGVARDITERKRAEEERNRLIAILESTSDFVGIANAQGRGIYINRGGKKLLGMSEDEDIAGFPIIEGHPESMRSFISDEVLPAVARDGIWSGETALLSLDGREIPVLQVMISHKAPDGKIELYSTIARDITERKRTEEKILKQDRIYRVTSNINQTIVRVPNQQLLFDEVCRIAVEIGQFKMAWIGVFEDNSKSIKAAAKSGSALCESENLMAVLTDIKNKNNPIVIATGTRKNFVCNDIESDSKMESLRELALKNNFLSLCSLPITVFGKIYGTINLYNNQKHFFDEEEIRLLNEMTMDVSFAVENIYKEQERKTAIEEMIIAKERAESSDKLKTEFLAQMSHEIRTPLNALMSYTALLKDEITLEKANEFEDIFNGISNSGSRIIRTIDLILNASELQTGSYDTIIKKVDLYDNIILQVYNDLKRSADSKNLDFQINKIADNTYVSCDEYSVYQSIMNIVDNAIKYTKKGVVKTNVLRNSSNQLQVEIVDTGIGISSEYLKNLFEPFSQEESGYNRRFEGTGLGLSLVKKYCEINNIQIDVESKKNVGTKFTLTFNK